MKFSIQSNLDEVNKSGSEVIKKFEGLCEFLSTLGYKGIELAVLKPDQIPINEIKNIADSYQLQIPALGTGGAYLRLGYSLGAAYLSDRQQAIDYLNSYYELASICNSKIIIGLIRGRYRSRINLEIHKRNIVDSLKKCCRLAENYHVELVLEPINRFEIDTYNTTQEAVALLNTINADNLKIMIDTFHMHLEEDPATIWTDLESSMEKITHIHLADDMRRAPGTGSFDFQTLFSILKKHQYTGFASLETIMKPSFEKVAEDSIAYLNKLL